MEQSARSSSQGAAPPSAPRRPVVRGSRIFRGHPVNTSGREVPPPVNTFAEVDLDDAVNENMRRCKYVRPTPVQRHAIPISLAGRDLMACVQTGSGKTATFGFPIIISGIMRGPPAGRPHRGGGTGMRTRVRAHPLAHHGALRRFMKRPGNSPTRQVEWHQTSWRTTSSWLLEELGRVLN